MLFRTLILPSLFAICTATSAAGITFQIDFSVAGSSNVIGTFEAPELGGVVSAFEVTLAGVTFDTQLGGGAFEYDAVSNDFQLVGSGFPGFTNSTATSICGVGSCFLELYPTGDGTPGDYLAVDALLANIDDGTRYRILPAVIPLPATLLLLLGGLASIGATRMRRA